MPLLSPTQIHEVLKRELPPPEKPDSISTLLKNSNLTAPEVLENLSSLMRSGETDGVKLKAAETALKLNGLLGSDESRPDFSVTIIINDSNFEVNPILIPRPTL